MTRLWSEVTVLMTIYAAGVEVVLENLWEVRRGC